MANNMVGDATSSPARTLVSAAWALTLISVPITSFPLLAQITGGNQVSPLAAVPLLIVVFLGFIPSLVRGGAISRYWIPLAAFGGSAALSSLLAVYRDLPPVGGHTPAGQLMEGLAALALGMAFYFVASRLLDSERQLSRSLRWIYLGALLMLLWSTVQLSWIRTPEHPVPDRLREYHRLISVRDPLRNRVTGLAFEPSWAADQLVVLYLPLWLACLLKGYSAFRIGRLPVELPLLVWGSIMLYLTFSRIGLVAAVAQFSVAAVALLSRSLLAVRLRSSLISSAGGGQQSDGSVISRRALLVGAAIAGGLTLLLLFFLASRLDERFALLFETDYFAALSDARHPWPFVVAARLAFAERIMYWVAGFRIFGLHPLFGVGLENAGLLFGQTVPYFGFYLPEILQALDPQLSGIPNLKSLWVRLLAETGIVGFLLFIIWLALLGAGAAYLHKRGHGIKGVLGTAGLLALTGQIFEGFSLDTFALPQLWIMLGLLTAALDRTWIESET